MSISGRNLRFCAVLLIGGMIIGFWVAGMHGPLDWTSDRSANFFGVVAQIAATMMGFLLAALAILASIAGMRLLRNMQRTGHYAVLLSRLFISAAFFFLLMLVAIATMLLGEKMPYGFELVLGVGVGACGTLVEACRNLAGVLLALRPSGKALE